MDAHPAPAALSASRAALAAFLVALFVRTFLVQLVVVSSGSMEPTLLAGDTVLVDRLAYARSATPGIPSRPPRRGDVVVFRRQGEAEARLVKRCVAGAGDRVRFEHDELWVDGEIVPALAVAPPRETAATSDRLPSELTLPPATLFLVGDHRFASRDSRDFGPVPTRDLLGRAVAILWSRDPATGAWRNRRIASAVR